MKEIEELIAIPISEYEHLKQCKKDRIDELQRKNEELHQKQFTDMINGIVNASCPLGKGYMPLIF